MKPSEREPVNMMLFMIMLFATILLVVSLTSCSDEVVEPSGDCYQIKLFEDTYLLTSTDSILLATVKIGDTWGNTCTGDAPSWYVTDSQSVWIQTAPDTLLHVYTTKAKI